ncbi:MAG: BA14K family protein [Rhodopseudomonas sp.]|nr:BA14K family protein [Rhodopseudomonas sp.]
MRFALSAMAVVLGAGLLAAPVPAVATPIGAALTGGLTSQAQTEGEPLLLQVQHRPRGGGPRHGGGGGGHDNSGAVAAGILGGLFLGAIIANQAQHQNAVDYCMRRYRSYDPRSGTYLGYDGYRHPCP